MTKTVVVKPLGLVLRKAGLISSDKINKALEDSMYLSQYRLGEILAIKGWIKPETANFFAEVWPSFFQNQSPTNQKQPPKLGSLQPLGKYLQAAGLLSSEQIRQILEIQKERSSRFGKIAVEQKLISSTTLEFFLEHLNLIKTKEEIKSFPEAIALELDRVESYLINNHKCEASQLLDRYSEILTQSQTPYKNDLRDQQLLTSGIVTLEQNYLRVTKPIYQQTFNHEWLDDKLAILRPYNQIRIKMFDLAEKVNFPYKVINAVNYWTNNQVFLTQKLLQIIQEKSPVILPGEEMDVVGMLVHKYVVSNWQSGKAAKHFQAICERLKKPQSNSAETFLRTHNLLNAYKRILRLGALRADNTLEQRELLRIGLIRLYKKEVSVSNPIYQAVFSLDWVKQEIKLMQNNAQARSFQIKIARQSRSKQLNQPLNLNSVNTLDVQSTFKQTLSKLETDQIVAKKRSATIGLKARPKVLPLVAIATSIAIIPPNVLKLLTPKQPSQLLEQGNILFREQKYNQALQTFDKLIKFQKKRDPESKEELAQAYSLKGKSQLKLLKYIQALETYQQALNNNPESISAQQGLGIALSKLGQEDEANRIFEVILQKSNISPEERGITWWYWGQNFCNYGNHPLASYSFKKALEFPTGFESEINSALENCDI